MRRLFFQRTICMIALVTLSCSFAFSQDDVKHYEFGVFAGASINSYTGNDIENADMKMGFNVGITGRYYIYKNLFGELSVGVATKGYKQTTSESSGQYWDDEGINFDSEVEDNMTTYNLDIPLYVGYRFPISETSSLSVKIGPYITYAFSGKLKTSGYVITYPDIHSSEKEYITQEKKIGDMDDYRKFGVGIGCGIGYNYKNYGITASFQRGLTKLYDKKDIFEQNISLSLSYSF